MKRLSISGSLPLMYAAALFAPVPLAAQGGQIWVEPHVGWLVHTRDLGRTDILGQSGFGTFEQVDNSAVLGVAAGVALSNRLAIRAAFDHALDASVKGEWQCVPFVACPSVLLPLEGQMSRWTVSIDGLIRPVTGFPVDPFFVAGLGLQRSALDWTEPEADVVLPAFAFEETNLFYRVGMGFERAVGRTTLFGEFAVITSRFGGGPFESVEGNVAADRKVALDLSLVSGVRIRLR